MERRNNIYLVEKFLKFLYPYVGKEIIIFLLLIITSAGSLATPYVLKVIIDSIFPRGNYQQLVSILTMLIGIYILRIVCEMISEILYKKIGEQIVADIRSEIIANILNRPIAFFQEVTSGEVLFAIMNDVNIIQEALSSLILSFLNDLFTITGILIMLFYLNYKLAIINVLAIPLIIISIRYFTPRIQKSFRVVQELEELLNNYVMEKLKNIRVIKSYNSLDFEKGKLRDIQSSIVSAHVNNTLLSAMNRNIITLFVAVGPVIVLLLGGKSVLEGTMSIGALIAFIQYLNRLYSPSISIINSYTYLTKTLVSMDRIDRYMSEAEQAAPAIAQHKVDDFDKITLRNVSLQAAGKPILRHINMTFEKGKVYGMIGPSGAGKSSVVNLLCRFAEPTEGEILLDDRIPLSAVSNWNAHLGLVEKENQLFNGTIHHNIMYGVNRESGRGLDDAIAHSQLDAVIQGLPEGLDTVINNNGSALSDGQKQRISLARVFVSNPRLIILDEATASLDTVLEKMILENIRELYKNAIVIIITHRLSALHHFDHVYKLSHGALITD